MATLSGPKTGTGEYTYNAPGGAPLAANTQYAVTVESASTPVLWLASNNHNQVGGAGWGIADFSCSELTFGVGITLPWACGEDPEGAPDPAVFALRVNASAVASPAVRLDGAFEEENIGKAIRVGDTLTAEIDNRPPNHSVAYAWYRGVMASGAGGTVISGEAAQTYTTRNDDVGKRVAVEVTLTPADGTGAGGSGDVLRLRATN